MSLFASNIGSIHFVGLAGLGGSCRLVYTTSILFSTIGYISYDDSGIYLLISSKTFDVSVYLYLKLMMPWPDTKHSQNLGLFQRIPDYICPIFYFPGNVCVDDPSVYLLACLCGIWGKSTMKTFEMWYEKNSFLVDVSENL